MQGRLHKRLERHRRSGFALVVALGLMAFVLLLLLSITTLVQVESQSAGIAKSQLEAEQSALLAMQMAIGELQAFTGLDTRVTASSTLLNEDNVPVTGVWRSWEGSDRQSDGKPIIPNYAAKRAPGDLDAASPEAGLDTSSTAGRFLGWLTSAELPDDPDDPIPTTVLSNTEADGLVPMVSLGSVSEPEPSVADPSVLEPTKEVYLAPTLLGDDERIYGSMAWWVSGDNAKAMINDDQSDEPTTVQDWQQRVRSNGWADPAAFDFGDDDIFDDKLLPSNHSLGVVVADPSAELRHFHDMTTFNRGLLTNTAVGGWRRDLSLMTESYDGDTSDGDPANNTTTSSLPSSGLPFYTIRPGVINLARKAVEGDKSAGALLYPWATYRNIPGNNQAWAHTGPICSWTSLVDYANQYKSLDNFSISSTEFPMLVGDDNWPYWNGPGLPWADKIRVAPVISRVHWIFSLASEPVSVTSGTPPTAQTKYQPKLLLTPAVTIWNPYNVELSVASNLGYRLTWSGQEITPFRFKFSIDDQPLYQDITNPLEEYKEGTSFAQLAPGGGLTLRFPTSAPVTLKPGESRLYSVSSAVPVDGSQTLDLVPGYEIGGGFLYEIDNLNSSSTFPPDPDGLDRILVDGSARFAVESVNISPNVGSDNIGVSGSALAGDGADKRRFPIRNRFNANELASGGMTGSDVIQDIYPPIEANGGVLYQDQIQAFDVSSDGTAAEPFAAGIFASRATSPLASFDEPDFAHLETKGFLQTNPLCYYIEMRYDSHQSHGSLHPANSPYAFSFREVNGWNDTAYGWIPQVDPTDGVGSYIVSGMGPSTGLTRCVMAELPTRPLQSLADLQHWDARNNNSLPPFQFNIIGNGSATPLIPADELSVLGPETLNQFMCNDDSYLLNHLLFDDWFVSSIAPDYGNFGTSPNRSIGEVYEQHLTGEEPLPNRFYLPREGADSSTATPAAANVVSGSRDSTTNKYAFESVASELEVAGMFNVNSTSLDAWRALLRHARDVEVPYLDGDGRTVTDDARSFSYPRTSIAGDQGSDSGSTESGSDGSLAPEFAGHRVLTEPQIDRLAVFIVEAIRERGPFLSLSEFLNRQLTTNADLALAGTIQSALDELANLGSSADNPFSELQANSVEITSVPSGNHEYEFPQAALGHSAFGVPGWIRQADIIRPLAPILSARDDTFTIRSYGDVRDPTDPTKIVARVWCEAVVVRSADFVDPADDATILPHSSSMVSASNERFGRKYKVASFRWLNEEEI